MTAYYFTKVPVCILYGLNGSAANFTNLSGGNLVDDLQPACIFGPKHNFSFVFWFSLDWQNYFGYRYFSHINYVHNNHFVK